MPATRDEIAHAFNELAARYGFRRTAVDDVARALRISKKTIYKSFSSKEELLQYAIELSAEEQCSRVEAALTETTALGRLQQVATMALADARRFYEANPRASLLEPAEIIAQVNARVFGRLVAQLLAEGMATGEFEVTDPPTTVAFLNAIGMQAVRIIHDDPLQHPEEAMLDALRRLLVKGRGRAVDDRAAASTE